MTQTMGFLLEPVTEEALFSKDPYQVDEISLVTQVNS